MQSFELIATAFEIIITANFLVLCSCIAAFGICVSATRLEWSVLRPNYFHDLAFPVFYYLDSIHEQQK